MVGIFHRGIAQLVEQRSPKPRAEGSNPSTPAKDRQCKADGLFVSIYRKVSDKQVGQTANTVLPVLCMCCVLLMGLPAGVSVCFHIKIRLQMPWPSCAMLGLATTVGANIVRPPA